MNAKTQANLARTGTARVAYNAGPAEITFAGRAWRRGEPQEISTTEWEAMQQRADFPHFDFKTAKE